MRCWGLGIWSQRGYGNTITIGDDEPASVAGDVIVGGIATQVDAGGDFTCALLTGGLVRCWGSAAHGQLGHGNTDNIGDDETPASAGDVPIGELAVKLSAGSDHVCALLASGAVRCLGSGGNWRSGYGDETFIGDDELPAGNVQVI